MSSTFYSDYYPSLSGIEGSTIPTPEHNLPGISKITFYADYTGVLNPDQLPREVAIIRTFGSEDVSSETSWSLTNTNVTASINTDGIITITAVAATGTIQVTSTYKSVTLVIVIEIEKIQGLPPTSGGSGGGTSSYTSSITSSVSASYGTGGSGILSAVAGTNGEVACSFPASFQRSTNGNGAAYGKWQWRIVGGSFADIATEISSDVSSYKAGSPEPADDHGNLIVFMTKTSLTTGTTYEFQLLLRSAGAYSVNYYGTASVVGS